MQRGADLKRRKCELQIETSQLTIEAAAYRVQTQESRETRNQKKRRPADDNGGGRIIETNVNDGWEGEARLAEEEKALTKLVAKM